MSGVPDGEILDAVHAQRELASATIRFVHEHPELGHEEFECSAHLAAVLADAGFEVKRGVAGLPTAFRASITGGRPGRTVGVVAMYDAVAAVGDGGEPVAVHSCGHGPISGAIVAMATALAQVRERLAGRVIVVGCPADEIHAPGAQERGGGKALTVSGGAWDDIDVALYAHPEFVNTVSLESLWMWRQRVRVTGVRSLRPGAEQRPIDAFREVAAIASHADPGRLVLERVVLDGDVEESTGLMLDATFLPFAESETELDEAVAALRERLPHGTWVAGPKVAGVRPHAETTAAVADAFRAAGRSFVADPDPLPFATDYGNISRHVAAAALIGVGREGGWAFHLPEGAEQFAGPDGEDVAMGMAEVLALSAARLTELDGEIL
jgi:metal-dependent amidase/aminoacylase/carboxypeptidase family protein